MEWMAWMDAWVGPWSESKVYPAPLCLTAMRKAWKHLHLQSASRMGDCQSAWPWIHPKDGCIKPGEQLFWKPLEMGQTQMPRGCRPALPLLLLVHDSIAGGGSRLTKACGDHLAWVVRPFGAISAAAVATNRWLVPVA